MLASLIVIHVVKNETKEERLDRELFYRRRANNLTKDKVELESQLKRSQADNQTLNAELAKAQNMIKRIQGLLLIQQKAAMIQEVTNHSLVRLSGFYLGLFNITSGYQNAFAKFDLQEEVWHLQRKYEEIVLMLERLRETLTLKDTDKQTEIYARKVTEYEQILSDFQRNVRDPSALGKNYYGALASLPGLPSSGSPNKTIEDELQMIRAQLEDEKEKNLVYLRQIRDLEKEVVEQTAVQKKLTDTLTKQTPKIKRHDQDLKKTTYELQSQINKFQHELQLKTMETERLKSAYKQLQKTATEAQSTATTSTAELNRLTNEHRQLKLELESLRARQQIEAMDKEPPEKNHAKEALERIQKEYIVEITSLRTRLQITEEKLQAKDAQSLELRVQALEFEKRDLTESEARNLLRIKALERDNAEMQKRLLGETAWRDNLPEDAKFEELTRQIAVLEGRVNELNLENDKLNMELVKAQLSLEDTAIQHQREVVNTVLDKSTMEIVNQELKNLKSEINEKNEIIASLKKEIELITGVPGSKQQRR